MRQKSIAEFILTITVFVLGFTGVMAGEIQGPYFLDNEIVPRDPVTDIAVPAGFKATVFADIDGYARHMAVRDDGTVYLALTVRMGRGSNMGIVAMGLLMSPKGLQRLFLGRHYSFIMDTFISVRKQPYIGLVLRGTVSFLLGSRKLSSMAFLFSDSTKRKPLLLMIVITCL